jgi:hypothetical protein
VLEVEASDVGSPQHIQVRRPGSGPPQPQYLRLIGPRRQAADLDEDDGPAHDGPCLARTAAGVGGLHLKQPPGANAHGAVLLILAQVLIGRRRPGRRNLAANFALCLRGRPPWARALPAGGSVDAAVGVKANSELPRQPHATLEFDAPSRHPQPRRRAAAPRQRAGGRPGSSLARPRWHRGSLLEAPVAHRGEQSRCFASSCAGPATGTPSQPRSVAQRRGGICSRRSTGRERARLSHAGSAATPETHQITIPMISG